MLLCVLSNVPTQTINLPNGYHRSYHYCRSFQHPQEYLAVLSQRICRVIVCSVGQFLLIPSHDMDDLFINIHVDIWVIFYLLQNLPLLSSFFTHYSPLPFSGLLLIS